MSRRRHYLLIPLLVLWASASWAANAYQTYFKSVYCVLGSTCNVYWPMDETSGTVLDNACRGCGLNPASGYDLTTVNTPTLGQAGVNASRGTSILFDAASTEYAEVNANDTGSGPGDVGANFTTGCWAKVDTAANRTIISNSSRTVGAGDFAVWSLAFSGGNMVMRLFNPSADGNGTYIAATGATSITTNTWYFYVATWQFSGTTLTVYLNGAQDGTNSTTSGNQSNAVEFMALATRTFTTPQFLQGYLQDCFIIKQLLNPATLYCVGVGSCTTDDWPYNVKAPVLPKYVMGDYGKRLIDYGYTTGLWTEKVKRPRTIGPFVTFAAQLPGDFGWRK